MQDFESDAEEWSVGSVKLLSSCAVAATFSGLLGTLSGVGAPPLILMYEILRVPKVGPSPNSPSTPTASTLTTEQVFFMYVFENIGFFNRQGLKAADLDVTHV